MIKLGYNVAETLIAEKGYYNVELCSIALPHLPISNKLLSELKLTKHELVCHFSRGGKVLNSLCAFKLAKVWPVYHDNHQILRGMVRSCGVGQNLATYLKNERQPQDLVRFRLHADVILSSLFNKASEITQINGFSLDIV